MFVGCPNCGADRLIPLTFDRYQRRRDAQRGQAGETARRVAKYAVCGERTDVSVDVHRFLSSR